MRPAAPRRLEEDETPQSSRWRIRGTTTEETVSRQINQLWEHLGPSGDFQRDNYMVAVYENPGISHRRNEIWFLYRES
ncbi:unnamed protein product [Merluccius merluccius]